MDVAIDDVTMAETLDIIDEFVRGRTPRVIITANVDHLMLLRRDEDFRHAYRRADLVTCDSIPLKWALRFLNRPVKERVAGADMVFTVAERAAQKGWKVFYLGGAPGVAAAAAKKIKSLYPALEIAGVYSPPMMSWRELAHHDETVARVRAAQPDILFVAFGAPKQEIWLDVMRDTLGVPVGIGIGGALDFPAGRFPRAPRIVQNAGLEWLWRLGHDPKRLWKRYLFVDSRFAFYVLREKIKRR